MTLTTISSRELNQDVTRAKKAAKNGPVIITDRGRPAYVLLSFEDYQRLTRQRRNIVTHWRWRALQTSSSSRRASRSQSDRRNERDALIAATVLVHGMAMVTRNVADFESTGADVVNPWESLA